jgi:hypothetical protein
VPESGLAGGGQHCDEGGVLAAQLAIGIGEHVMQPPG